MLINFNWPNFISFARLLSVPFIVSLVLESQLQVAFFVFLIASVSDLIDGYLARILKMRTRIGKILDPLADKTLLVALFLVFGHEKYISPWLVTLVVFRDVLIIGGSIVLSLFAKSFQVKPLFISKINTVIQLFFIGVVFASLSFWKESFFHMHIGVWIHLKTFLEVIVGVTTLLSGGAYVKLGWQRMMSEE